MAMCPVRCFGCGQRVAGRYEVYRALVEEGETAAKAFALLNVRRDCCKSVFLSHVETHDEQLLYHELFQKYETPPGAVWIPRSKDVVTCSQGR